MHIGGIDLVSAADKLRELAQLIQNLDKVAIAFSGGVDSTFLAAVAKRVLPPDNIVLVTAYSATLTDEEKQDAENIAAYLALRHQFLPAGELENSQFLANTPERCYHCKKGRFTALIEWATQNGFNWVLEGTNADDLQDYRPGLKALAELEQVQSPLLKVGLGKQEIRQLSQEWGLPTYNKPSAACLVSRLAYGLPITVERLQQVAQAEKVIRRYCSGQVRVRHHGEIARIEVNPAEFAAITDNASVIVQALADLGFKYVTLDLLGYRTGSMNETLNIGKKR